MKSAVRSAASTRCPSLPASCWMSWKNGTRRWLSSESIMPEPEQMTLAETFPHIPHDHSGECCGCIRPVETNGHTIELRCNECGAIVGVLDRGVLEDLVLLVNANSWRK